MNNIFQHLLQLWRWALSLLRRGRREREMEEEMRFHSEMQIEQTRRLGWQTMRRIMPPGGNSAIKWLKGGES